MQLERKTLEQRKRADEFYENKLMALIEEDFIERNQEKVNRPNGMYSPAGPLQKTERQQNLWKAV